MIKERGDVTMFIRTFYVAVLNFSLLKAYALGDREKDNE